MDTIIEKIKDNDEDIKIIEKAAKIINAGGLVAFPTETVYGLGGDAFDETAAARIYAAKGRPSDNPLIVHIAEPEDIYELSDEVPKTAMVLAKHFWPGPLTMIVKKNSRVPKSVTGGLDTVAVRLPSHPVARELIRQSHTFIAAPSANISGRPSPTKAEHVIEDLKGRIDMIIDDGAIDIGLESTIVDLTGDVPVVLRPGFITQEMLSDIMGKVELDKALMTGVGPGVVPKAPGMKYRHYAPKADLTIVEGAKEDVLAFMKKMVHQQIMEGKKAGVMVPCEDVSAFDEGIVENLGSEGNYEEIARHLFDTLRDFDEKGVEVIYSVSFATKGFGQAVMNRLLKAAGHKVVKV